MENRSLGRGRVSVPVVGLGTWRRLEAAAAAGRHRELIDAAIAAGIRLFDTSPMYGDAERLGALNIVAEMLAAGRRGSVVTLICDGGERYRQTYGSDDWLREHGLAIGPYMATLRSFVATGDWRKPCSS
jgi:aryl-alcohol dehydrogenase-like predicted oxidoreductase